ncbi:endoplasmic reticulum resident 27 [Pelobates cultripes]|uniref:Endoplasmic reticulum resident 27 n=1 Tax=Pelobates cultripes TaxID=61616 RepID=A0AAD1SW99_PELCU|nr:endoplasmic reticulum resident 27 [Pelobates cultripes]
MAWSNIGIILMVCLLKNSSCSEVLNTTITTEFVRQPTVLQDVSAAKDFISSNDFAIIAFVKDSEEPEVKHFYTLFKNHPEWDFAISTSPEVLQHFKIESTSLTFFRQVDNTRTDLVLKEYQQIDTAKMYRFLSINELRWVTSYNSVTAVGVMASEIQVHLLLFVNNKLENEEETLKEFREAAKELQGQVLFVKVDALLKSNERSMAYFKLQKNDLPKVVIYNTENETKQFFKDDEFTAERLKTFCLGFLSGDSIDEDSEKNEAKTEL